MARLKVPILVEMDDIRAYLEQNDIVEVVRCRDCKHFVDEGFYCAQNILPMFDHFYCYYGERKESE